MKLKVIFEDGFFLPDTRHIYGGTDVVQAWLFHHLFPEGFCPFYLREVLETLAAAHGWDLVITEGPEP